MVMNDSPDSPLLDGIRVLLLAVNVPGPVAAARLTEMGAAIDKIEPPGGDPLKLAAPDWYRALHQSMTVHNLDLKQPQAQDRLAALLAGVDLLLTSLRPAALERLGLAWPSLAERYPRLCQVAITGYPPPDENLAGHDLNYQAALGLLTPPALPRTLIADLGGAQRAVTEALALLLARERDRLAQPEQRYRVVALSEGATWFARPLQYGLTVPGGLLGGGLPNYNLYPTADGWIAVGCLEPHFWLRLIAELGLTNPDHADLAERFATQSAAHWEAWGVARDIPIAALQAPANS